MGTGKESYHGNRILYNHRRVACRTVTPPSFNGLCCKLTEIELYLLDVILCWVYDVISHLVCKFYTFFKQNISGTNAGILFFFFSCRVLCDMPKNSRIKNLVTVPLAFFCFLLLPFSPIFSLTILLTVPRLTEHLEEATRKLNLL